MKEKKKENFRGDRRQTQREREREIMMKTIKISQSQKKKNPTRITRGNAKNRPTM